MRLLNRLTMRPWMALTVMTVVAVLAEQGRAQGSLGVSTFSGDGGIAMPKISEDDDIQVTADRMSTDRMTQMTELDGNVKIVFGEVTMTCDRATYHEGTGDIHAEGDINIESTNGSSWQGEQIDFNHKTGEGLFSASTLKAGVFTVKSDSAARDDDGVLHARRTKVTTCENPEHAWHWSLTGEGAYKTQEFVEMRNAILRLFGLPIFWIPYYYRDLNTEYGVRFLPGRTGKWGAYLLTGYVYPIAGSIERDRYIYGKTVLDFREKFGVGAGQEFTWGSSGGIFGESTIQRGRLALYYAHHKEDQKIEDRNWNSSFDENRWSIGFEERLDFTPRDFLSITGEMVSDSQFLTDYDERRVRASSQPLGIINYEHRENAWVTSLAVAGPIDTFYAGTRRLPELRLDLLPQNVFGIEKLYYESQNSFAYLRRQPAKIDVPLYDMYAYSPGNWAYYDAVRIDTRHVFRRPFVLAEGVTLTPRFGWRGTSYSDSPDKQAYFRSLFEIGTTLQARYWRDFESYRHTVIPYLDLTHVPGSQFKAHEQPFAFDWRDQEYEWRDRYRSDGLTPTHRYTGLRFGTRQYLHERDKKNSKSLTKILNLDLYGVYVFQTQDHWKRWGRYEQPGRGNYTKPAKRIKEPTGLRVIGANASYSPYKNVEIFTDTQYDPKNDRLAVIDINARYHVDPFIIYTGYLRRDHEVYDFYWSDYMKDSLVYGGLIHYLSDLFAWSSYARYNLHYSELEEIGGFIQYSIDCLTFRMNIGYRTKYYSEDNFKHGSDTRIGFDVFLSDFPPEEDEDWMNWGNFSTRQDVRGK